jgi:hypothetical protein
MAFSILELFAGLVLLFLGYNIMRRTHSDAIGFMGFVVLLIGLLFVAVGIGFLSIPQIPS